MTTRELEQLTGKKLAAKLVFVLVGDRLFHHETGDHWHEYPRPTETIA